MPTPDNSHGATQLIRVMEAAGMEITSTVQGRTVLVDAAIVAEIATGGETRTAIMKQAGLSTTCEQQPPQTQKC